MTRDQFWHLVEKVHRASDGDMDKKCELLGVELRKLGLDEVRSFHDHFNESFDEPILRSFGQQPILSGAGARTMAFRTFVAHSSQWDGKRTSGHSRTRSHWAT